MSNNDLFIRTMKKLQENRNGQSYSKKILKESNKVDLEGEEKDVITVIDPDLSTEDFKEKQEEANKIIDETPEGEQVVDTEYVGMKIYTCPLCLSNFYSETEMQEEQACPVCYETPTDFIYVGTIEQAANENDEQALEEAEEAVDNPEEEIVGEEPTNKTENEEDKEDNFGESKEITLENKICEDQYEAERRKEKPDIKEIAKKEVENNLDWYLENIKGFTSESQFVSNNEAEIAEEYNLKSPSSEECCKEIYRYAMNKITEEADKEIDESITESLENPVASLQLSNDSSMVITKINYGIDDTVEYGYLYGDKQDGPYESTIEYDEEGNPFFKDKEGQIWMISDFMKLNEAKLSELQANVEDLDDYLNQFDKIKVKLSWTTDDGALTPELLEDLISKNSNAKLNSVQEVNGLLDTEIVGSPKDILSVLNNIYVPGEANTFNEFDKNYEMEIIIDNVEQDQSKIKELEADIESANDTIENSKNSSEVSDARSDLKYAEQQLNNEKSKPLVEDKEEENKEFNYALLNRLQSDCDYFLKYGNRNKKVLWAGNVEEQIAKMKDLWNSFSDDEKPEWLSMQDIENYEEEMLSGNEEIVEESKSINSLSKFIYDLCEPDEEKYGVGGRAWSACEPQKDANNVEIIEVYKNGPSTLTMQDIIDAVKKEYDLKVYGKGNNSVYFTK